jgi:multidrug efflux pump subunit AcrA (membrane-fusion protein)
MDTTSLYAIFPVREKDALRIEKGMSAVVLIDGTGEKQEGVVDLVYPQADSQSLSFLVRVLLRESSNNINRLKPGMFTRVTVTLGPPKGAVFIPENSIFNRSNSAQNRDEGSIFVINGRNKKKKKIVLGSVYGEDREITAGIKAGEIVVLRPDSVLREGSNVTLAD